jgi:D-alanyl-D-alanine carboxypeptidase (penicillin-binding protein 5/6)
MVSRRRGPTAIDAGSLARVERSPYHSPTVRRGLLVLAALVLTAGLAVVGAAAAGAPAVQADAYVLTSAVDGTTLAAREPDTPRAMASITKLMTALVARRSTRLDDVVVVPAAADAVGESSLGLRAGQRVSVRDLLIGTLVPSANDAATALAAHVGGGSVARFVARMNATAQELGLSGTRYRNPHGLDQPGHLSTARDSLTLLRAALRDPFIRRYAGAATATLSDGRTVESTDNLIGVVPGLVGGKTGHTDDAGWSQTAVARRGAVTIGATVLGAPSEAVRDADLAALLRYGLASYRPSRVVDPRRAYASVDIGWGIRPVALVAAGSVVAPVSTRRPLVERVVAPLVAQLPVRRGQRLGTLVVLDGERVVARSPLVAARAVDRPGTLARARFVLTRTIEHLVGWLPG